MSFFRPSSTDRVRLELAQLRETLDRHEKRASIIEESLKATPPADPVDPVATASDVSARLDALATQMAALDGRVTSVATELANQLGELGNDIESLSKRPPGSVDEELVDGLRDTQTRLANEQARYQIAFREDLARMAEQFRRTGR